MNMKRNWMKFCKSFIWLLIRGLDSYRSLMYFYGCFLLDWAFRCIFTVSF